MSSSPTAASGGLPSVSSEPTEKLAVRVRGVHHRLQHIEAAARITLETHLEFSLHCILFTVHIGRVDRAMKNWAKRSSASGR